MQPNSEVDVQLPVIPNREELAWAAGFFDGEGNINARTHSGRFRAHLSVPQTDPYTLERFQRAVGGIGHIYKRQPSKNPKHNQRWDYSAQTFEGAQATAAMLWNWLSPIKRLQVEETFKRVRQQPPPFSGKNSRTNVQRRRRDAEFKNPNHRGPKLSMKDVIAIHEAVRQGEYYKNLAAKYKVSDSTICHIIRGDDWAHVKKRLDMERGVEPLPLFAASKP